MQFPQAIRDRQSDYFAVFDDRIRRKLQATLSDTLIDEHRQRPLGQHSDALERLLNYFRRGGLAGKIGILQADPSQPGYQLVRFAGVRGGTAEILPGNIIPTLDEAYHAAFLLRIADLKASLPGENR
jgi:branched-chain amino acid transport system permease protein